LLSGKVFKEEKRSANEILGLEYYSEARVTVLTSCFTWEDDPCLLGNDAIFASYIVEKIKRKIETVKQGVY